MRAEGFELPLRIVVEDPIPDLAMGLQRGAEDIVGLARSSGLALTFDLGITVQGALADGRPRLLGPYVQGPPAGRFVYLRVGLYAGQADSPWGGRVKVPLGGITWAMIEELAPNGRIEGRIGGRGRKAGPALASVPILAPGWRVAES